MARFYFDIFDGVDIIDEEGTLLASLEEAKKEAASFAAGLLRDNPSKFWDSDRWTVRVRDERGFPLFEVAFLANFAPGFVAEDALA